VKVPQGIWKRLDGDANNRQKLLWKICDEDLVVIGEVIGYLFNNNSDEYVCDEVINESSEYYY
jgi:hypothetical protein